MDPVVFFRLQLLASLSGNTFDHYGVHAEAMRALLKELATSNL